MNYKLKATNKRYDGRVVYKKYNLDEFEGLYYKIPNIVLRKNKKGIQKEVRLGFSNIVIPRDKKESWGDVWDRLSNY